ncbi:UspA domain-containing protein OS=Kitasatospora aureofaciens OX=1894 GN=GCM10010502_41140 PE=4 SV=1 [Kitasatospora aureofaciens]
MRGEAGPVLTAMADRPDGLLVISAGRHGSMRGRLRRLLRGSVARYCLDHARGGVWVVPPSDLHEDLRALHRDGIGLRELIAA